MKEALNKADATAATDQAQGSATGKGSGWWHALRARADFGALLLLIGGFAFVAAQRLGTIPVPEGDEAMILQLPYEVMYRGKFAWPMFRLLGGNIENVWHSLRPVYFWMITGVCELFGLGIEQGRIFNLVTAVTTLLMVYLISRRLFDWRAGMFAVLMLVGDQTFLERSRLIRNDYAPATFALLAFYLYEIARERQRPGYYIAAGLAVGCGVMSHTNILYMIIVIGVLILLRDGWRALKERPLYLFGLSAVAVMAYEIIYDIIDYRNLVQQYRTDDLHFRALSPAGIWQNLLEERLRYGKWLAGSAMFDNLPQATLRVFQLLSVGAVIYLTFVLIRRWRGGRLIEEPRARVFIAIVTVVLFHALIVSHKRIYYMAHIAPWFAIGVGILLRDAMARISAWRTMNWPRGRLAHRFGMALVALAVIAYGGLLIRQATRFIQEIRNPELATFDEFAATLKEIIPEGLCPVAVKNPSVWLAFPESDRCFATIENRMKEALDLDGKEYALITRPNVVTRGGERASPLEMAAGKYHLLGEMQETAYGSLLIYYTGRDPRILALAPKRFQFYGLRRGRLQLSETETSR
ncbi:MAG TPA: glycosyltransferase family 39 protein [Blastocatellia bacterium]|nr:glycosyltransferase family 39 protein [Blastocatellia bacterium]